jgi:hypothetical protein
VPTVGAAVEVAERSTRRRRSPLVHLLNGLSGIRLGDATQADLAACLGCLTRQARPAAHAHGASRDRGRHKDLDLKDLGASDYDSFSSISWMICGKEFMVQRRAVYEREHRGPHCAKIRGVRRRYIAMRASSHNKQQMRY